ncbi:MAG: hypothetical protein ACRDRN_25525 [Sciscionella sp.]
MTDSADQPGIQARMFELLLGFAGRLDDSTLAHVRKLLAITEADRALVMLAGGLAAGRIPVSEAERSALGQLNAALHLPHGLLSELMVDPDPRPVWHRFNGDSDTDPRAGVIEAIGRSLDGLPSVRGLHCVWRATPAGALAEPVPRRVVLVETARTAYPAAIGYRLESALRRGGMRAGVEVLPEGMVISDYHRAALAVAMEIPLPGVARVPERRQSRVEPAEVTMVTAGFGDFSAPPADSGPSSVFFPDDVKEQVKPRNEEDLNERERDLLRQLHEELGKREDEHRPAHGREDLTVAPDADQRMADAQTAAWPAPGLEQQQAVNGWPVDHHG